jgi:hypothetical protein
MQMSLLSFSLVSVTASFAFTLIVIRLYQQYFEAYAYSTDIALNPRHVVI